MTYREPPTQTPDFPFACSPTARLTFPMAVFPAAAAHGRASKMCSTLLFELFDVLSKLTKYSSLSHRLDLIPTSGWAHLDSVALVNGWIHTIAGNRPWDRYFAMDLNSSCSPRVHRTVPIH
jgi:hypothetical protein